MTSVLRLWLGNANKDATTFTMDTMICAYELVLRHFPPGPRRKEERQLSFRSCNALTTSRRPMTRAIFLVSSASLDWSSPLFRSRRCALDNPAKELQT